MNRILKSKYKVEEKIAENLSHITYKGTLVDSEKEIVVKIYKKDYLNTFLVKKLKKDIENLSKLESPLIPKLIDGDYGWQGFYFVREYVNGASLNEIKTPVDIEKAIQIILGVCNAVKIAHENKIFHGSITLNNVFVLNSNWKIKVSDFGIKMAVFEPIEQRAKLFFDPLVSFTPPEFLLGENLSVKSDIYQIGLLLAHLLSNEKKQQDVSGFDVAKNIILNKKRTNFVLVNKTPKYLEDIIFHCIEKEPLLRFNSVDEIINCLATKSSPIKHSSFIDLMQIDLAIDTEIVETKERETVEAKKPEETIVLKDKNIGIFDETHKKNDKINFIKWAVLLIWLAILAGIFYSLFYIFVLGE